MRTDESSEIAYDRLRIAAFELASGKGLGELSTRSLAAHTGGSPSAVNYHFGGRSGLLCALLEDAVKLGDEARELAPKLVGAALPHWTEWPDAFTAFLQYRLEFNPSGTLLFRELAQEAVSTRAPELVSQVSSELQKERFFWHELASRYGVPPHHADIWADLAVGLTDLLIGETDSSQRAPWITGAASRLHSRLNRHVIYQAHSEATVALNHFTPCTQEKKTAVSILEAALTTIALNGAEKFTQREVAALANVSLAAVTFHFPTKNDLIRATFEELHRRLRAQAAYVEANVPDKGVAFSDIGSVFKDQNGLLSVAALNALLRAAARDASLVEIARQIRQIRGIGSKIMLAKKGINADWSDAYAWAVISSGRVSQCLIESSENAKELLEQASARSFDIVFDRAE